MVILKKIYNEVNELNSYNEMKKKLQTSNDKIKNKKTYLGMLMEGDKKNKEDRAVREQ